MGKNSKAEPWAVLFPGEESDADFTGGRMVHNADGNFEVYLDPEVEAAACAKAPDVLTEPLTGDRLRAAMDADGLVSGVVSVDLAEAIDRDGEGWLDLLSTLLVGNECLMDINYKIVGHVGDVTLLVEVEGDASEAL